MTVDEAIKQVSEELNIDEYVVRRAYYSQFEFIIETVTQLPLKEKFLSKEELSELKKVFYMPSLGKINVPYSRYKKVWEAYLKKKESNKDVQAKEN
jgi:hypothetical protein